MKKLVLTLLAVVMVLSVAVSSFAGGTANGTMTIVTNVGTITNFAVTSLWDISNYDPSDPSPVLRGFANPIRFDSSPGIWYRITASYSGNTTAGGQRNLANGTNMLQYNIYIDSARSQRFGDYSYSGDYSIYVPGASNAGGNLYHPVYLEIPAGQSVPVGQYSDAVTYTIRW